MPSAPSPVLLLTPLGLFRADRFVAMGIVPEEGDRVRLTGTEAGIRYTVAHFEDAGQARAALERIAGALLAGGAVLTIPQEAP